MEILMIEGGGRLAGKSIQRSMAFIFQERNAGPESITISNLLDQQFQHAEITAYEHEMEGKPGMPRDPRLY